MKTVIVTGSAGLVGSEAVRQFSALGYRVVGIDNDMRRRLFGDGGSTAATKAELLRTHRVDQLLQRSIDIRDRDELKWVFHCYGDEFDAVIHTAAQPSHDWAAREPRTDFDINATGTLNLLELCRQYCPGAAFVHCSTNKVYGDNPNRLPLVENDARLDCPILPHGIDETMSVDQCTHSLFGASKLAADILVQEYGRYFNMATVCFRGGCLTGPGHAGVPQHGFLSYLVKCAVTETPYQIIGYGGRQVRDNLHAADLVAAFVEYVNNPTPGAVYNIGGGPSRSCSVLEAVGMVERITGRKMQTSHVDEPRIGDHKWWITDTRKFEAAYPGWKQQHTLESTITEIVDGYQRKAA